MSILAIERSLHVIRHLKRHGNARFKDLAAALHPISRTALSMLLQSLVHSGEVIHNGRWYQLSANAVALDGARSSIDQLPPPLRQMTDAVLAEVASDLRLACALFSRVGTSTMKIMSKADAEEPARFSPVGYEWPLVPFHGFAQILLAYEQTDALARDVFYRWRPYLAPNLGFASYSEFKRRLASISKRGFAVEYKEESEALLRIAVPVFLASEGNQVRFAVGIVAHPVYLLAEEQCVGRLREAAATLSQVLSGRVPRPRFDAELPERLNAN